MSSPLSSLKKPHKQPLLPGSRSLPFRHPEYNEDESKLLEEITTNMATARMKMRDPFIGGLPKLDTSRGLLSNQNTPRMSNTSSLAPSDHDLMSAMMSKITALEQKVMSQSKDITEKDKRIRILEDKLKILQTARNTEEDEGKTQALEKKCLLLQQNVHEMETFLADYGMVWVGDRSDPNSDVYNDDGLSSSGSDTSEDLKLWRQDTSLAGEAEPPALDFDKLLDNIKDLNVLAGEGVHRIQHTTDGARLKMPDPVDLAFYANGIMMYNGPFRPYTDPQTKYLIKDIMDGYFPSELQSRYPDGIPFVVKDFRHTHFEAKKPLKAFKGTGQTLGGETKPSRLVASHKSTHKPDTPDEPAHKISVTVTNKHPGRILSKDQFLNKLPKSVVKGGKIVDIRGPLNEHLSGDKAEKQQSVTVVETDTVNDLKKRLELEESVRPDTPRDITTLRIKSETGNNTYILKMKFTETIGDVRKYLDSQRSPAESGYHICSAYPNKTHSDSSKTLEDSGLTPNAVLHLRPKKGCTT